MRIAMVGPFGFHPNKTMYSRALGLARPLVQQGHVVQLFMPPWQTPAEADKMWQEDGVGVRYVPLGGGVVGITRQLVREVLAWQPDVVHCFKPKAYSGLVAWWLWHFHRHQVRLVMDTDDWEGWGGWNEIASYSWIQKRFFAWQEVWGMRHCHGLTVASRTLQSLAWGLGVSHERVVYVPNGPGVAVGEPWPPLEAELAQVVAQLEERPTLLLYSRLFEFDTGRLVAVLQRVKTAVVDLHILAVGTGLYESDNRALRQQLAQAGLLDCVIDVGWVERAQLPSLLLVADVGIYLMEDSLLNRTKCPVKLADMVALGLPVVAEAVGQVGEYVRHNETGILCETGDVSALSQAIITLLQSRRQRMMLGQQARTYMQTRLNWSILSQKLVSEVY